MVIVSFEFSPDLADTLYPVGDAARYGGMGLFESIAWLAIWVGNVETLAVRQFAQAADLAARQGVARRQFALVIAFHDKNQVGVVAHGLRNLPGAVCGQVQAILIGDLLRCVVGRVDDQRGRSEEHTSELQSLMRISYAVFCLT